MNIKYTLSIILVTVMVSACSDFLDIDPPSTQVTSQAVFSTEASALSAVNGLYNQMIASGFASGGSTSITVLSGLSSDELVSYSTAVDRATFATNSLRPTNGIVTGSLWTYMYKIIYGANSIIAGLEKSTTISPDVKSQLVGEAKFVRAFTHFYLTNLFGDVPLVTTTDYLANTTAKRTSQAKVIEQVITDLSEATSLMSEMYPEDERVRPNKLAAAALLARVYLYNDEWVKASELATTVINSSLYELVDPAEVFLKDSREAIWQLRPSTIGLSTLEGNVFVLRAKPNTFSLSPDIYNLFSADDIRRDAWIGTANFQGTTFYYPFKYKEKSSPTNSPNEYSMVVRLAEMFLIRSEAKAMSDDIAGSSEDLNVLRHRAGIDQDTSTTKEELLTAIENERRKEMFTEWGHRWFDLKRTNRADQVLLPVKNGNWQTSDQLYPIPKIQIDNAPGTAQNPGY